MYGRSAYVRVQLAARLVKSRYTRYSIVSDMLDELGWPALSHA